MSRILLDTDVLIDLLRGRPATKAFVLDVTGDAVPCCSVISVAELTAGMRRGEEGATSALLDGLVIFPVTREIAEVAGRFKQAARSRRLELADCVIAATAFVEGAPVATSNVKDYPMPEVTVRPARR
ncbi:MAG: type II toxin-antitoxin system VapC family toxin [Candidatus Rokubacteria bacterium]|nr:type II toxin-antitoxin system VapC family toxin [Candidatus Rokubacteria bacterium]